MVEFFIILIITLIIVAIFHAISPDIVQGGNNRNKGNNGSISGGLSDFQKYDLFDKTRNGKK